MNIAMINTNIPSVCVHNILFMFIFFGSMIINPPLDTHLHDLTCTSHFIQGTSILIQPCLAPIQMLKSGYLLFTNRIKSSSFFLGGGYFYWGYRKKCKPHVRPFMRDYIVFCVFTFCDTLLCFFFQQK